MTLWAVVTTEICCNHFTGVAVFSTREAAETYKADRADELDERGYSDWVYEVEVGKGAGFPWER